MLALLITALPLQAQTPPSTTPDDPPNTTVPDPPNTDPGTAPGTDPGNPPGDALPSQLINISTRGPVQTGDNVMIAGFVIEGSSEKTVLIRVLGPSLAASNVPDPLQDPFVQLFEGSTLLTSNDDFADTANANTFLGGPLEPSNPKESVIVATLDPGEYTAIVRGVGETTGNALVEVFDQSTNGAELINISTRGPVETGDSVMIAGFVIEGGQSQRVLIRAVGPSLAGQGVPGSMSDPFIQLFEGSTLLESNDNFGDSPNLALFQGGTLEPGNANEPVIVRELDPGEYTAIVRGVGETTGVALVEVFDF
ncbi:MAG: hypothetical protein ACFE0O_15970 [Opitutales bacterium]